MYIRNDGKGESNITQNGFTAYLLSAVAHRKADYLHAKQRRQAREVLTDPDLLTKITEAFRETMDSGEV